MSSLPPYVLVSPCLNETEYLDRTVESVLAQTHGPALWVIVDDGSTDATPRLLEAYAREHDFIRVVTRPPRTERSLGKGVVQAVETGLAGVDLDAFAYLGKLDMDIVLPPRYYERLIRLMEEEPRLGNLSGKAYFLDERTGREVDEVVADDFSVGAAKLYRRECFADIGGLRDSVMWDGVDCYASRRCGWWVRSLPAQELRFLHLRRMGSSDRSIIVGRERHGRGLYYLGSSFPFVLAAAMRRLKHPPAVRGATAIVHGYVKARRSHEPQVPPELRAYIRRYQHLSLVIGKRRTMERFEA
jgi:glycosyltransferase involved in cell wall biosynthesis